MSEYLPFLVAAGCAAATFAAMKMQRLLDAAPLLALLFAGVSNYAVDGMKDSGIAEMIARIVISYAVIRIAAELTKRSTAGQAIRYATEQPVIEFEEVA